MIERIEFSYHQLPLDPPFPAAWDRRPRHHFPVAVVRVFDDSGAVGIGAGDPMRGLVDYLHLFLGTDPTDLARHGAVLANIAFHDGRPWPLDTALWDLTGKLTDRPIWRMVGGRANRLAAYASSGIHRSAAETEEYVDRAVQAGFSGLKLRFGRASLDDDFEVLDAACRIVPDGFAVMVDCNQGWRMPWDTGEPWDVEAASQVATRMEELGVYWIEEPLHRGDHAGMAELRRRTGVRIAGGEMTRELHEFDLMLEAGSLDVYQPDVVTTGGIGAVADLARRIERAGLVFSPHTWGSGIALLANAHLTAGTVGTPFLEFPFDPPHWDIGHRDFLLDGPVTLDADGMIDLGHRPGLGVDLDEDALACTETGRAQY
jgi:L-alanine-DL-glutamate epimerase-like enolase superfamily enzyme